MEEFYLVQLLYNRLAELQDMEEMYNQLTEESKNSDNSDEETCLVNSASEFVRHVLGSSGYVNILRDSVEELAAMVYALSLEEFKDDTLNMLSLEETHTEFGDIRGCMDRFPTSLPIDLIELVEEGDIAILVLGDIILPLDFSGNDIDEDKVTRMVDLVESRNPIGWKMFNAVAGDEIGLGFEDEEDKDDE